jgi:hypothetical protein
MRYLYLGLEDTYSNRAVSFKWPHINITAAQNTSTGPSSLLKAYCFSQLSIWLK